MLAELPAASPAPGLHVAVIMDGNGRWATARRKPRTAGHRAGTGAVRRTVEAAPQLGIATLTLYAFSCDNWRRPPAEVAALWRLLHAYLRAETGRCVEQGVRLAAIGRRDRLPARLAGAIRAAEETTRGGTRLFLRLAVDYSSRDAILAAARRLAGAEADSAGAVSREAFSRLVAGDDAPAPDVDLLIRTGGEQRLSDFLLWESAYAELVFLRTLWPDFGAAELTAAVAEFHRRERRFGGVPEPLPQLSGPAEPPSEVCRSPKLSL